MQKYLVRVFYVVILCDFSLKIATLGKFGRKTFANQIVSILRQNF